MLYHVCDTNKRERERERERERMRAQSYNEQMRRGVDTFSIF